MATFNVKKGVKCHNYSLNRRRGTIIGIFTPPTESRIRGLYLFPSKSTPGFLFYFTNTNLVFRIGHPRLCIISKIKILCLHFFKLKANYLTLSSTTQRNIYCPFETASRESWILLVQESWTRKYVFNIFYDLQIYNI